MADDYQQKIRAMAESMTASANSDVVEKLKNLCLPLMQGEGAEAKTPEIVTFIGVLLGSLLLLKPSLKPLLVIDVISVVAMATLTNGQARLAGESE